MKTCTLSRLSDPALLRDLKDLVVRDCTITAELLAHLAEVDARKLYLPAAYPSMYAYCVGELHFSEDVAFKRIRAARAARQFPAIYDAVAQGRLHLSGVVLLAPYLSPEIADELLLAAEHKTRAEIEVLLAERFPRPELATCVSQLAPGPVEQVALAHAAPDGARDLQLAPGPVASRVAKPVVAPIAPQRFTLQLTMNQAIHEKLRYAQSLLGPQIPSGDLAQVLDRALDSLIERLEKRKFAATRRPRPKGRRPAGAKRTVPAHVKRAVWARDSSQCTFVSETGRRCAARECLEFDHVDEVARGGEASIGGIRLRCRAHNQYQAECTFGAGFMERKREEARRAAAERRQTAATADAEAHRRAAAAAAAAAERASEVIPWLKRLGFRDNEIRHAVALCSASPEATLEERVRLALSHLGRRRS